MWRGSTLKVLYDFRNISAFYFFIAVDITLIVAQIIEYSHIQVWDSIPIHLLNNLTNLFLHLNTLYSGLE